MTSTMNGLRWPDAQCCWPGYPGCQCPPAERALRAWMNGATLPAMTAEQREFCLSEIEQVEGHRRDEHVSDSDADLSRATIDAWTDYCRDKGLA